MNTFNKKSGFTLLELMITLSIMGIVIAISVLSYNYVLQHNSDRSAAALGEAAFQIIKSQYEKNDFSLEGMESESKVQEFLKSDAQVETENSTTVDILYFYRNKKYKLQGDLRTNKFIVEDSKSGDIINEN